MKNYLIFTIGVCLFFGFHARGQKNFEHFPEQERPYFEREAKELVKILKEEEKSNIAFKKALQKAITNYKAYHYYSLKETPGIFNLIFEAVHQFKDEYYRFLMGNKNYFSQEQLEQVKQDMPTMLNKTEHQFYDIIVLYQLNEYKPILIKECDSTFYAEIKNSFLHSTGIPGTLLKKARALASFIDSKDAAIEDSLIDLVNECYRISQNTTSAYHKQERYHWFFVDIVPNILGNLNSKKSVERTIHLILDDYDFEVPRPDDIAVRYYRDSYIMTVILPKLSAYEFEIELKFYDVFDGSVKEKRAFYESLYTKIRNGEVSWKGGLIDVN